MKKFLKIIFICFFIALIFDYTKSESFAQELDLEIQVSNGADASKLKDNSYYSVIDVSGGDTIKITSNGEKIKGLYIIWDSPITKWELTTSKGNVSCGENEFLHEYINLESLEDSIVINIPEGKYRISDIRVFGEGELPDNIQVWNKPCDNADVLVLVAHADDEILFFGGILATYGGEEQANVQVAYMSEFWESQKIREHEKLDGLWASGIRSYPICGGFADVYSMDIETAENQYETEKLVGFAVNVMRRCKPQVVVSHDFNGEYGHGFHRLTAKAVSMAVEAAADETLYSESFELYGAWNVPKTYFHLLEEKQLNMDLRKPLTRFNNKTALEVAQEAYKLHVSQQWCWFYVDDEYEYSCAKFGLYRTSVGDDTGLNNLLENIKTYKVQEEESVSEAESISESISIAERESSEKASEEESIKQSESDKEQDEQEAKKGMLSTVMLVMGGVILVSCAVYYIYIRKKRLT